MRQPSPTFESIMWRVRPERIFAAYFRFALQNNSRVQHSIRSHSHIYAQVHRLGQEHSHAGVQQLLAQTLLDQLSAWASCARLFMPIASSRPSCVYVITLLCGAVLPIAPWLDALRSSLIAMPITSVR